MSAEAELVHPRANSKTVRVLCLGKKIPKPAFLESGGSADFQFITLPKIGTGDPEGSDSLFLQVDAVLVFLDLGRGENLEQLSLPKGISERKPLVVVLKPFDPGLATELLEQGVEEVVPHPEGSPLRIQHALLSGLARFRRKQHEHAAAAQEQALGIGQNALQTLNGLPFGVLLIDQESRALFMNKTAKQIFAKGIGLYISQDKRCCARDPNANAALHRLVKTVSHEAGSEEEESYVLKISSAKGDNMTVLVVPVGHQPNRSGAALFLAGGGGFFDISADTLRRVYGLTGSESELLLKLVQGNTLAEIAESRNVSVHTVRAQLKSIFLKTDTQRQAGLIKKVLTGPAVLMHQ